MFERIKAKLVFGNLLKRPNIDNAYKMVGPEDSWYDTISCVHRSLAEIQKLPHETLEIESLDGLKLRGIYYPAAEPSKKTVIAIHGYSSHAEREWAFPGLFYHSLGFNVLIPYQRAHGISEGDMITFGAKERSDMIGWAERINELSPDGEIVFHGLSMGGLIALLLINEHIPGVKAIISDAPSTSIEDFFRNVSRDIFKAGGDAVAKAAMDNFERKTGRDPRDYNAKDYLKDGIYPLLLSAGELEMCDERFAEYKAINPSPTEIIILPGCNHGNGMYKQTELYQSKIREFLAKYM